MNCKQLACSLLAATLLGGVAHAATVTLNGGGSSLAYPPYSADFKQYTSSHASSLFSYAAAGSGAGQKAFLGNNIGYFEPVSGSNTVGYAAGTLTYGTIVGTQVDFGASDAFLTASQLTNPATGSYTESSADGPLIQIPTFGTPITIPYNQSADHAVLKLTDPQLCGVFSGLITDWHSLVPSIPAGTNIEVIYRSDGSGTSFLLTQHLTAVCTPSNSAITFVTTKTFASEFANSTPPANFTGASGSAGVASDLVATSNSIGYLSPDYTSIAPNSPNTTSLLVASLVNANNKTAYQPTVANTKTGLLNPGTGSINSAPPAALAAAQDPLNWVPAIPVTKTGYPIVGYTTIDASSCYQSKPAGTLVVAILKGILSATGAYATNVTSDGFVTLQASGAAKFYTAVVDDLVGNTNGYNLNIDNTTTCASYVGR